LPLTTFPQLSHPILTIEFRATRWNACRTFDLKVRAVSCHEGLIGVVLQ